MTQTMSTGAVLNLDLSDPTQFLAYVMRRYQHDVFSAVVGLIRPGGVFFDVGAHVGLVSLPVAVARPDARVVAFEADRRNAELFRVNASLNPGCSVTLVEAAIGAEPGTASVVRGGDSGHSHIALSGEAGDRIPQITLDSYVAASDIEEVDVLKLDVEGFEPYVLQGARGLLLAGRVRAIVCEVLDPNLERFGFDRQSVVDVLRHHGFEQESIPPLGLGKLRGSSNRRPAPDLLFLRGGR